MQKRIFFFIGTEAELIKVFPVIIECKKRKLEYKIIASGQNDIVNSKIFRKIDCGGVDIELSKEADIRKSTLGLIQWFLSTYMGAEKRIKTKFADTDFKNSLMVVHGDTVSTLMGAQIGKKIGLRVCHIEAGLRSHNFFNPFPEEIDRLLTSRRARMHFAPGKEAAENLNKAKGIVIDTKQNTLLDSLQFSLKIPASDNIKNILNQEYFVFIMHRQENLANKSFVTETLDKICKIAEERKCVIILHEITKNAFIKYGLLDKVNKNPNIISQPRVDYFDFMKILDSAEFVITDGGSNQEELFYMGKPCLIMRKTTERNEGIGENAVLFQGDLKELDSFARNYVKRKRKSVTPEVLPSAIVVNYLKKALKV